MAGTVITTLGVITAPETPFVTSQSAFHRVEESAGFPQPHINAPQEVKSCLRFFKVLEIRTNAWLRVWTLSLVAAGALCDVTRAKFSDVQTNGGGERK